MTSVSGLPASSDIAQSNQIVALLDDDARLIAKRKLVAARKEAQRRKEEEKNALLEWLHEQACQNAKLVHELRGPFNIYGWYGLLDAISLSYSLVKYIFDLLCTNTSWSSSDWMHEWMLTEVGIATVILGSLTFIILSIIANTYDKKDENAAAWEKSIETLWSWIRDTVKALKNAFKGLRSVFLAIGVFSGSDLSALVVPVSLVFGVVAVANRIWYRSMKDTRKESQSENTELFKQIKNAINSKDAAFMNNVSDEALAAFDAMHKGYFERGRELGAKSNHLNDVRTQALLSAAYLGFIDGLYLYMGAISVVVLAPTSLAIVVACSAAYSLLNIASRMYEEYEYQRKLTSTQARVELALCGQNLQFLLASLQNISKKLAMPGVQDSVDVKKELESKQATINADLDAKHKEFEKNHKYLVSQVTLTYPAAVLAGIRYGLYAYGALMSGVFALAIINSMFLIVPISATFLLGCVVSGTALLLGFLAYVLIETYLHQNDKPEIVAENQMLAELLNSLKLQTKEKINALDDEDVAEAILGGLKVDESPQFFFQEWFEVIRSLFSGFGKGQKSIDYTCNPLQEIGSDGHYHDSWFMFCLAALSSFVSACVLALRAFARGFWDKGENKENRHGFFSDSASAASSNAQSPASSPKLSRVSSSDDFSAYAMDVDIDVPPSFSSQIARRA